jgi:tetraprenyl-beta-curcumene synthase
VRLGSRLVSAMGSRRFVARAGLALAFAHGRYWTSVAPLVRRLLRDWEARASEIPDPHLNYLAVAKLRKERFNVEVAAMIATIAPAEHRERAVEAIVALQVMYDFLDALTEQPAPDRIRDGLQQSGAFLDALCVSTPRKGDYYAHYPDGRGDAGYLEDLAVTVRGALRGLPAVGSVSQVLPACAARCAEAQVRVHAVPDVGLNQLEQWATSEARDTELQWREWLFGAMGSVVAAHALIALAADARATRAQAHRLDSTYLSLCVLTTALDHLVDHESDVLTGAESYLYLYSSREDLARQIALVTRRVLEHVRGVPNGPHHAMILSGVVAYYTSQPGAMGEFARPVTIHVRDQLRPLITPTLATLHAWRVAKRLVRPRDSGRRAPES